MPEHNIMSRANRTVKKYGLLIAFALICIVLSLRSPAFLTAQNGINVLRQISINAILAIGVTYVILTGGIDLSLGSVVAVTGVLAATLAHPDAYPLIVPIAAGLHTRYGVFHHHCLVVGYSQVAAGGGEDIGLRLAFQP